MSKNIEISMDSIQALLSRVQNYFSSLTMYQMIAWGAIGLGLILIIVSLIIW